MGFTPTEKIWFNGKLVPWHDAKVHVLAHGLHYGTGVFEGPTGTLGRPSGPIAMDIKACMVSGRRTVCSNWLAAGEPSNIPAPGICAKGPPAGALWPVAVPMAPPASEPRLPPIAPPTGPPNIVPTTRPAIGRTAGAAETIAFPALEANFPRSSRNPSKFSASMF